MSNIEKIKEYLKINLTSSRYNHVMGVVSTAKSLAMHYNYNVEKAEIAALCHDIAKNIDDNEMLEILNNNNITLSIDEKNNKSIWHAIIGPIIVIEAFNIKDEEILNAIRWHTTGRENMSILEKIIYLADMIEPLRDFNGVEDIRINAFESLDNAMIKALTHTTTYLLNKGFAIDVNTIKARNYLLYTKNN